MEYIRIVLRMSFFYFFIILIYRLMGKREVGQLGIVDLIVSILIAELVAISVEDTGKSILISVVPIISVAILQMLLSYLSLKSNVVRCLLDGKPSVIIDSGKISYCEMVKQKYNLDDLLTQLREQGYRSIEDIEYAILENSGKLSVFSYDKKNNGLPLPIIIDGKIQYDTLKYIKRKEEFVKDLIKDINIKDIFYAFYKNKKLFIIKYSELKK